MNLYELRFPISMTYFHVTKGKKGVSRIKSSIQIQVQKTWSWVLGAF